MYGGTALTYAELDERSDRLARHLVGLGVGPDRRVAICLEQSAELAVAVVGVLKAGGAYVPLDPEHPEERLAYALEDAGVTARSPPPRCAPACPAPPRPPGPAGRQAS